ncbi:hypothetical protein DFH09DRAFT_1076420 [Mycena vulgaris]|nr:hypothetical protein DFH09DRAFT_1076420 [Mycena vulgaris]
MTSATTGTTALRQNPGFADKICLSSEERPKVGNERRQAVEMQGVEESPGNSRGNLVAIHRVHIAWLDTDGSVRYRIAAEFEMHNWAASSPTFKDNTLNTAKAIHRTSVAARLIFVIMNQPKAPKWAVAPLPEDCREFGTNELYGEQLQDD